MKATGNPSTVPLYSLSSPITTIQPIAIRTILLYCNSCLFLFQLSCLVSCYRKEKEQKKTELLWFLCGRITRKQPWMVRHLLHTDYIVFTGMLNCFALDHMPYNKKLEIKNEKVQMFGRWIMLINLCVGFSWFAANDGWNNFGWWWFNDWSSIACSPTGNSLPCTPRCWFVWWTSQESISL